MDDLARLFSPLAAIPVSNLALEIIHKLVESLGGFLGEKPVQKCNSGTIRHPHILQDELFIEGV